MIELYPPKIAVLIASHNRRELTAQALRALRAGEKCMTLQIVVFDDGSSDGTAQAVQSEWPEAIVLRGDGESFWNGGMHAAWRHALGLQADGYLWLNDDVQLDDDALPRLAKEWTALGGASARFILVGATRNKMGNLTYGGQRRVHSPFAVRLEKLPICDTLQKADTFNGNIVLVSQATVDHIGINDPNYIHALGDIDYGFRATKANIPIFVISGTLGTCENNTPVDLSQLNPIARWRYLRSPKVIPPKCWWRFTRQHSGFFHLLHFLIPYRKVLFPNR